MILLFLTELNPISFSTGTGFSAKRNQHCTLNFTVLYSKITINWFFVLYDGRKGYAPLQKMPGNSTDFLKQITTTLSNTITESMNFCFQSAYL